MKPTIAFLSAFLWLFALPGGAHADNCNQAARALAGQYGADVLQVRAVEEGGRTVCLVTLRIPGRSGEPPRVETVRVNG